MLYAIGDIHGQLDMLHHALDLIDRDGGPDAPIVFVGDYTDRGPDSRGVVEFLIQAQDTGRNWTFLKGNHDRMFMWFLENPSRHDPHLFLEYTWTHPRLGGDTTLESYGMDLTSTRMRFGDVHRQAQENVPAAHIEFLRDLPLTYETDDLYFVHAGVRPGVPFKDQVENDLLWIREEFVPHTAPYEKLLVHGHTALDHPTRYSNRINLDGGAGYGRPLVPVVFEGTDCWILGEDGRQPILRG